MNINIIKNEEKTIFALAGKLDAITSPKLQDALLAELGEEKHVELDLSGLAYISSAGLRVLLMGEKTAKAYGGRQTIVNITPGVMEVFEMTGFSNVLHIE